MTKILFSGKVCIQRGENLDEITLARSAVRVVKGLFKKVEKI